MVFCIIYQWRSNNENEAAAMASAGSGESERHGGNISVKTSAAAKMSKAKSAAAKRMQHQRVIVWHSGNGAASSGEKSSARNNVAPAIAIISSVNNRNMLA